MNTHQNPKLYNLIAVSLLSVNTEDIMDVKNKQTFEIIYKWILKVGVPQLNAHRSGLLEIGPEERNKHVLLDFIEEMGMIIKGRQYILMYRSSIGQ